MRLFAFAANASALEMDNERELTHERAQRRDYTLFLNFDVNLV